MNSIVSKISTTNNGMMKMEKRIKDLETLTNSIFSTLNSEIESRKQIEQGHISSQSGMSGDFFEIPFLVGLTGVKSEKIEEAKSFIISALKSIAQKGLDKDLIEAAIRRQEFASREIPGGIPNGFRMLLRCSRSWVRGENIIEDLAPSVSIAKVRSAWQENPNIFNEFIERELVNNNHRLTLTVISDDKKASEDEKLLEKMAIEMVNEKTIADEKLFEAFISKPDSEDCWRYTSPDDLPAWGSRSWNPAPA